MILDENIQLRKSYAIGHTSFEFQTRNYITCFGHICNHTQGQENHTQKYINMVLITV